MVILIPKCFKQQIYLNCLLCIICGVSYWQSWKHISDTYLHSCSTLLWAAATRVAWRITDIRLSLSPQTASGLLLSPSPLLSGLQLWNSLSPVGPLSPGQLQGHAPLFQVKRLSVSVCKDVIILPSVSCLSICVWGSLSFFRSPFCSLYTFRIVNVCQ